MAGGDLAPRLGADSFCRLGGLKIGLAAIKTQERARERVEDIGCDELLAFMTAPVLEKADRLAEAVLR